MAQPVIFILADLQMFAICDDTLRKGAITPVESKDKRRQA